MEWWQGILYVGFILFILGMVAKEMWKAWKKPGYGKREE